jgi:hypothetical protein
MSEVCMVCKGNTRLSAMRWELVSGNVVFAAVVIANVLFTISLSITNNKHNILKRNSYTVASFEHGSKAYTYTIPSL